MAHLHAVDKDINLALVGRIPEEQALIAVERVEGLTGSIAQARKQGLRFRTPFAQGNKVEILLGALQARVGLDRGTLKINRQAAQQAQRQAISLSSIKDAGSLFCNIGN